MEELKQELIEKIRNTQNENLLLLVKDDIDFYQDDPQKNKLGLTDEDYEELKLLANEPDKKDTTSFEEFKNIMNHWRMNS